MPANIKKYEIPHGFKLRHSLRDTSELNRIAWSPDGQLLAAGDSDTILVWNASSGKPMRSFQGQADFVFGVAWSKDGKKIAAATSTGQVWLWDITTDEEPVTLFHQDCIYSVAWSPDGKRLAASSRDRNVYVWDVRSGDLQTQLRGHYGPVYDVAWSPDGKVLASCSADKTIRLWWRDADAQVLKGHTKEVNSIAWSSDGRLLASCSEDFTVRVWSPHTARQTNILEGHINVVAGISFYSDNWILASKSIDGRTRLWRTDTWDLLAELYEPVKSDNQFTGLAFANQKPALATVAEKSKIINIWDLDIDGIFRYEPDIATVHYTSAKVVIVGESNVGKSCLALRLAENRYEEMGTTHGMRFWTMAPEKLSRKAVVPEGERRDIVLWDMGGQDEYRLVHQLFLHDTTLALVLLDPTRGRTAFEEAEGWDKGLEKQLHGRKAVKLLVGSKIDEDTQVIDRASIARLVRESSFEGYYPTSAKTGKGTSKLREAISRTLDWDTLAKTSRPRLFEHIRNEIENQKLNEQVVLAYSDLERIIKSEAPKEFEPDSVNAVVKQLALQGMIVDTRLATKERVLVLQVGEVERYAGSLIIAARNNPRNVPAIEERQIPLPDMAFPGIKDRDRLRRDQELVVLQCVVQLLLEHGICLQHEGLLIFPSLFQPTEKDKGVVFPHSISLYYDFSGAIDNIYSSLVVWLAVSQRFGRIRLWDDRAEFEQVGQGACGLRKVERGSGFAHLDVYFENETAKETRDLFVSFIEEHLRQNGIDILEHVEILCACGFRFAEESVRKRVADGFFDIGCPDCDTRTRISEGASKARERDPDLEQKTWALRTKIEKRTRKIVQDAKGIFSRSSVGEGSSAPIRILHLSDLHMDQKTDPLSMLQPLIADLQDKQGGLGLDQLDYLVVSGDLTNRAKPQEFEKARLLISGLIERFNLTAERCIITPGNHDLDWDEAVYDWKGKRSGDTAAMKADEYIEQERVIGIRNNQQYPLRFKNFSESFYHPLVQQAYPLEVEDQGIPFTFSDTGLQFVAMNSSWEIDEYFKDRSSINNVALSKALDKADEQLAQVRKARRTVESPFMRIAVWHHPVTGNDKIKQDSFLDRLRQADFRLCLHGHVHEERADLIAYIHPTRRIHVAGAGSFGAPMYARPESVPRLYNVLQISRDHTSIRVHTRSLRKDGGAWGGYAIWPGRSMLEHRTYYELRFRAASKGSPSA